MMPRARWTNGPWLSLVDRFVNATIFSVLIVVVFAGLGLRACNSWRDARNLAENQARAACYAQGRQVERCNPHCEDLFEVINGRIFCFGPALDVVEVKP